MLTEFTDTAIEGDHFGPRAGGIIGAAFGGIVSSLIDDVIVPVVGLVHEQIDSSKLLSSSNPNSVPVSAFGGRGA